MKIWICNHYAEPPEGRATRAYDLGRQLVLRGHEVTVLASSFGYYTLREERLRPGEAWREEVYDGVRFLWIRTTPYHRNDARRAMNFVSYFLRAFHVGSSLQDRPDAVIGTHVHPLAALAGYLLAKNKHARFYFEVTDLWPQTLIDLGVLAPCNPIAIILRRLESFLFQRARKIISLLPLAYEYMVDRGVPREKIQWIPNGVDVARYDALKDYRGTISDVFHIYYLGGLVRSNYLDVVLDAAKLLENEWNPSVRFVFVGGGTDKPRLTSRATELGLRNVEFRGVFSKKDIAAVMRGADAFIFSLRNLPLYRFGISLNKMCDYLASRRPIILAGNPPYNPVREAKCGIVVPPGDPFALANGIRGLIALPAEARVEMGRNGFVFLTKHHDMRVLGERLERILQD